MKDERLKAIIAELEKEFPNFQAAVFLHKNEKGAEVVSPLMKASTVKETLVVLNRTRIGIDSLIQSIVNSSLGKN
jgi:hypothetical protein